MLEKIISIRNIGRFVNCSPKGDSTFRRLTLIFAENGVGKTTLCSILRSLQTGQCEFISERKTIGARGDAAAQIRIASNKFFFSNNAWSNSYPDIAFFDSVFINDNVYAGNYVDLEHRKNLYRVIIGVSGVHLAKQVDDLDGNIRDANKEIGSKREILSKHLPEGITLAAYLDWQPVEDIDVKIQQKSAEIAKHKLALAKATEIQSKGLLSQIELPSLPADFTAILHKHLSDITADAETLVCEQVARHQMGNHGESWLSQGLGFVNSDMCPFCGHEILGNMLLAAYRTHFDNEYKSLKKEVTGLSQRITSSIGSSVINVALQTYSGNLTLIEFWKQFTEITLHDISFVEVQQKYITLLELSLSLAQKKQEKPTEPIYPDEGFTAILGDLKSIQQSVEVYNTAVAACNIVISTQKATVQRGGDAFKVLMGELAELEAKKKRFAPDVMQACLEHNNALSEKTKLERKKNSAKLQLNRYCHNLIGNYEHTINEYLDQFNAGFRITDSRHVYTGGKPSSHYQILINNTPVEVGNAKTPSGKPCFRTTLSSGDRSSLALAFFLAALSQDSQVADKIIILDDPFTSLDRFRRTCTQQLIRNLASLAQQVIILSHDPHFLKLIWDGYPTAVIKTLQLYRAGDNTMIGEWDIEAETRSTYLKNYSTLLDFYRDRTGIPLDVARAIRPFLEGMLRNHFPGQFQVSEWLGIFIDKIRNADSTSGLQHAQIDLPEIEDINSYSKKYHHDQNPGADSEPLSSDELHGFVKRTLRLVGGC